MHTSEVLNVHSRDGSTEVYTGAHRHGNGFDGDRLEGHGLLDEMSGC
jgi:hypothetical protein